MYSMNTHNIMFHFIIFILFGQNFFIKSINVSKNIQILFYSQNKTPPINFKVVFCYTYTKLKIVHLDRLFVHLRLLTIHL